MRTDEHVLQDAFGGPDVVLEDDVCAVCNGAFSKVDGHLIRFVRTLSLAAAHPDQRVTRHLIDGAICFWLDPDENVQKAVRTEGNGPVESRTPHVFQQLTLVDGQPPEFRADSRDGAGVDQLRQFIAELHDPAVVISTHSEVPLDLDPPLAPMIIRSACRKFAIIAEAADEARIRRIVASPTFNITPSSPGKTAVYPAPVVRGRRVVDTGSILQAVAKDAVNFVCKVFGREVALANPMAKLRRAARGQPIAGDGGTISLSSTVPLDVDRRSLAPRNPDLLEDLVASFSDEGQHLMLLLPQPEPGTHSFLLALYRRPIATFEVVLPIREWASIVVDYRNHTSGCFRQARDPAWFAERLRRFHGARSSPTGNQAAP
ncbi:MAG TPA: hypothetical protein VMW56_21865 [Candidatus Margulisiibacteriota bacterium]|nr:hypothetical protein [Candidatus Margulisiibacteriota bacterium]